MKRLIAYFPLELAAKFKATREDKISEVIKENFSKKLPADSLKAFSSTPTSVSFDIEIDAPNEKIRDVFYSSLSLNNEELSMINVSVFSLKKSGSEFSSIFKFGGSKGGESKNDFQKYLEKVDKLKKELQSKIIGQHHAIDVFISGLVNQYTLGKNKKGITSYTFCGPHAVGKTYFAQIVADFFSKEFKMPALVFKKEDYPEQSLLEKVMKFALKNPKSIIVFNDAEEFHPVFGSFLSYLFTTGEYADVSFKDITFIFTTCLGKSIYSSSLTGNLSTISKEAMYKAFASERVERANIGEISYQLANELTSQNCIMFNFIDLYSIKEIVAKKLEERFNEFSNKTGVVIKYDDKDLITSIFYMNKDEYNIASISNCLESFVSNEFNDIFSQKSPKDGSPLLSTLKTINFKLDFRNSSADVKKLFKDKLVRGLVICSEEEEVAFKKLKVENVELSFATSLEKAKKQLKEKMDFVLINVLFDLDLSKKLPANIEDYNNSGMKLFNHIINYYNECPLYILNNAQFGKSIDDYDLLIGQGAEDVLTFDIKKPKLLVPAISRIQKSGELTADVSNLIASKKVLTHNSKQIVSEDGTSVNVLISKLSLAYSNHKVVNHSLLSNQTGTLLLSDIIGNSHAPKIIANYISYLKNPKAYMKTAIKAPKGFLLYGREGVGKKSLVHAMVNEANVTYIETNAHTIINNFKPGDLTSYIHSLFVKAKENSPAVLMVDDIDDLVVDTRALDVMTVVKTFNAEISELNNDDKHPVIFVCSSKIDKGYLNQDFVNKLDRTILLTLPSPKEREKFIKNKFDSYSITSISDSVIANFASRTLYQTFGEINAIIEFIVKNSNGEQITDKMVLDAIDLCNNGDARESDKEEDVLRTSYHEIGHMLLGLLCGQHPPFVTIVSRGNYGGYTLGDCREGSSDWRRQDYLDRICISFGGRAAEMLIYGEEIGVNSGASSDLASATKTATIMVAWLGMGTSLMSLDGINLSEMPKVMLDDIDRILKEQFERAFNYLKDNKDLLDALAHLLQKEKFLIGSDVEKFIKEFKANKTKKTAKK